MLSLMCSFLVLGSLSRPVMWTCVYTYQTSDEDSSVYTYQTNEDSRLHVPNQWWGLKHLHVPDQWGVMSTRTRPAMRTRVYTYQPSDEDMSTHTSPVMRTHVYMYQPTDEDVSTRTRKRVPQYPGWCCQHFSYCFVKFFSCLPNKP